MAELKGQATPEQIAKWKEENPMGIYYIAGPKSAQTHIAYFREPTRFDCGKAVATDSSEDAFASIAEFGRLTFIGGSKDILDNHLMFLGAKGELAKHWNGVEMLSGNL